MNIGSGLVFQKLEGISDSASEPAMEVNWKDWFFGEIGYDLNDHTISGLFLKNASLCSKKLNMETR
jgi:hypothetical protein